MSRLSLDTTDAQGVIVDGYDYNLGVWVTNYRIENCGHPASWKGCCNARKLAGKRVDEVQGHEVRP